MDKLLCLAALSAIRAYQLVGRRMLRRQCLYEPTCSRRAAAAFRRGGFRAAWTASRAQLRRCNGEYALALNAHGEVVMTASDGTVFLEPEIAPRVADRLRLFADALGRPSLTERKDMP